MSGGDLTLEEVFTEGQKIWYFATGPRRRHKGEFIEFSASGKKARIRYEIAGTTFVQHAYVDRHRIGVRNDE